MEPTNAGTSVIPDPEQQQFNDRFRRLLGRLLDHGVVPFVGAGISLQAKGPNKSFQPSVWKMQEWLAEGLAEKMTPQHHNIVAGALGIDRKIVERCPEQQYQFVAEAKSKSLGQLAEVYGWLIDEKEACDKSQINELCLIEPLPAHVYFAYLAREGLLTRILSTNYDTCIERAFAGSFRRSETSYEWARARTGGGEATGPSPPLAVITDLTTFRREGSRQVTRCRRRRPVLHLYKINGCAALYARESDSQPEAAASRIALTERQLQRFRENWARDLFHDSARRFSLFFIGFGSEEPQIRYTILELTEELRSNESKERAFDPRTLPFLGVFEASPNFNHLQILRGFHGPSRSNAPMDKWLETCFSGTDARQLDDPRWQAECKMPADLLVRRIFQGAYGYLLHQYSEPGTAFYRWLRDHCPDPAATRADLLEWLYPPDGTPAGKDDDAHAHDEVNRLRFDPLWGRFRQILEPFGTWADLWEALDQTAPWGPDTVGRVTAPLRLSVWLMSMLGACTELATQPDPTDKEWPAGMHPYFPLREDPLLVLGTLHILHLLLHPGHHAFPPEDWWQSQVTPTLACGLAVTCHDGTHIHLVAAQPPRTLVADRDPAGEATSDSVLLRQAVVPTLEHGAERGRFRRRETSADGEVYRVGRYVRMSAGDLAGALLTGKTPRDAFSVPRSRRGRDRLEPVNPQDTR